MALVWGVRALKVSRARTSHEMTLEGERLLQEHGIASAGDRIVVLQQGRLIEEGDHDALVAQKGLYSRLYDLNYASFDDLPEEISDAERAMAT